MHIKELTIQAFNEYTKNSPLKNYMQTEMYARLMGENKYNYDYIGLLDENNTIVAVSLILKKRIGLNMLYGYAPKGFLVNYYNEKLLKIFTQKLKDFYSKKGMVFIKINPEIVVNTIDNNTFESNVNPNIKLKEDLKKYGFIKLKDNIYFEAIEPRFNAYIDLKKHKFENYSKTNRNKVRNAKRKGLYIAQGNENDLEAFYNLLNTKKTLKFYQNYYSIFEKNDNIDLILVKVNFEKFIKNSQDLYEDEVNYNNLLNEILHRSHKEEDLHKKMASDSRLCTIKNEIVFATEGLRNHNDEVIAGALVVKYDNRVHIVASGYDKKYSNLNSNYYLFDQIIENYKYDYDYLDLNGIVGDFKNDNPYSGLNRFKLGFNPNIYEYIGEFDLIFNKTNYDYLRASGKLAQEFNKKED